MLPGFLPNSLNWVDIATTIATTIANISSRSNSKPEQVETAFVRTCNFRPLISPFGLFRSGDKGEFPGFWVKRIISPLLLDYQRDSAVPRNNLGGRPVE